MSLMNPGLPFRVRVSQRDGLTDKILFNGTDLSPQCKYSGSRQYPGSSTPALGSGRGAYEASALALRNGAAYRAGAAGAIQPSTPCRGPGAGLQVLPHLSGGFELCRNSPHQDLHELPCADMDQRAHAGSGAV